MRHRHLPAVLCLALLAPACTTCWCRRLAEHDEIGYEPSAESDERETAGADDDPPERHASRDRDARSPTTGTTSWRAAEPSPTPARYPDLRVSPATFAPPVASHRTRDD